MGGGMIAEDMGTWGEEDYLGMEVTPAISWLRNEEGEHREIHNHLVFSYYN